MVRPTIRESLRSKHGKPHTGSAEWYVRPFVRVYVTNKEKPIVLSDGNRENVRNASREKPVGRKDSEEEGPTIELEGKEKAQKTEMQGLIFLTAKCPRV